MAAHGAPRRAGVGSSVACLLVDKANCLKDSVPLEVLPCLVRADLWMQIHTEFFASRDGTRVGGVRPHPFGLSRIRPKFMDAACLTPMKL